MDHRGGRSSLVVAFIGFRYWKAKQNALPEGIASGNGRLEAKLVDVAAKEPLRVKEILVDEGDLVKPGQVLVRLDTVTLEARAGRGQGERRGRARSSWRSPRPSIVKQKSEIELAEIEAERSQKLVEEGAGSQRELDVRTTKLGDDQGQPRGGGGDAADRHAAGRGRAGERGDDPDAHRRRDAQVAGHRDGCSIAWPKPGEVLAPGGKALTLVNLEDVYMEIFLPVGAGRQREDRRRRRGSPSTTSPKRAVAGYVSFVSPGGAVHAQAGRDARASARS